MMLVSFSNRSYMLVDLTQPDIIEHNHILSISLFSNHSTVDMVLSELLIPST